MVGARDYCCQYHQVNLDFNKKLNCQQQLQLHFHRVLPSKTLYISLLQALLIRSNTETWIMQS